MVLVLIPVSAVGKFVIGVEIGVSGIRTELRRGTAGMTHSPILQVESVLLLALILMRERGSGPRYCVLRLRNVGRWRASRNFSPTSLRR